MRKVLDLLFSHQEKEYGDFIANLTPTIKRDKFIGVRVPFIREIVKQLNYEEQNAFLDELPHHYYEEELLHGFIIQKMKKYDECMARIEEFLPYIDNWATSDTILPKCFFKNADDVMIHIKKWITKKDTFTVRFSLLCLMNIFIEDNFKEEYLLMPLNIDSDEYYIKMMIAWYYATALAKQYDSTIKIIEAKKLKKWIQNKTIQKAIESSRLDENKKTYLRTLKIA